MVDSLINKVISARKTFIILFLSVHLLNLVLYILAMGWWDGGLSFGFPKAFYIINCGLGGFTECPIGFNFLGLLIDLLFWYIVAVVIKIFCTSTISKN